MDLALKMHELNCYGMIGTLTVTHEETMETAIPEYCPDVERILDTTGQVCIKSKSLNGEELTVEGTVHLCILYRDEVGDGIHNLTLSVPFTCTTSDKRLLRCKNVHATGKLLLAETRLIHPRKISIRVIPECTIALYACQIRPLCTGALSEDLAVQTHAEELHVRLLTEILEKPFTFSEDGALNCEAEELLSSRMDPQLDEPQTVGSKILIKGTLHVHTLCRDKEQALQEQLLDLPFSQIVENPQPDETAQYIPHVQLTESEVRLSRGDEGNALSVTAGFSMLLFCYCDVDATYIDDLYSLQCPTTVKTQHLVLPQHLPERTVEAEEQVQMEEDASFAALLDCLCGGVTATAEDSNTRLHTTVHYKVMMLDEDGAPMSMERSVEVSAVMAGTVTAENARAECPAAVMRKSGGIWEIRFPVKFIVPLEVEQTVCTVESAAADTEKSGDSDSARPSIVLRRFDGNGSLWEIAKQYRTTEDAIREANGLKDELPAETMLLIPRVS
jgi:hypothetical protein